MPKRKLKPTPFPAGLERPAAECGDWICNTTYPEYENQKEYYEKYHGPVLVGPPRSTMRFTDTVHRADGRLGLYFGRKREKQV